MTTKKLNKSPQYKPHSRSNLNYREHCGIFDLKRPHMKGMTKEKFTVTAGLEGTDPEYDEFVVEIWKGAKRIGEAYFMLDNVTGRPVICVEPNDEGHHTHKIYFGGMDIEHDHSHYGF